MKCAWWGEPELVPLQLLSQLWCHDHGRMQGGDSADEVAEVNVVVTQSQMGCAEVKSSYSYFKPNIEANTDTFPC